MKRLISAGQIAVAESSDSLHHWLIPALDEFIHDTALTNRNILTATSLTAPTDIFRCAVGK